MLRTMGTTTSTAFGSGKDLSIFSRRHLAFSNTLFIIHQLEESQMMWNVQAWRWVGRCALWDREGFRLSETDLRKYLRKSSKYLVCPLRKPNNIIYAIYACQKLIWWNQEHNSFCQTLIWSESMKYLYLWNKDYWQRSWRNL